MLSSFPDPACQRASSRARDFRMSACAKDNRAFLAASSRATTRYSTCIPKDRKSPPIQCVYCSRIVPRHPRGEHLAPCLSLAASSPKVALYSVRNVHLQLKLTDNRDCPSSYRFIPQFPTGAPGGPFSWLPAIPVQFREHCTDRLIDTHGQ